MWRLEAAIDEKHMIESSVFLDNGVDSSLMFGDPKVRERDAVGIEFEWGGKWEGASYP